MKNLSIKTPDRNISIDLTDRDMSITIGQVEVLRREAPADPKTLEWSATLMDGETVTYKKAEEAVAKLKGAGWRLPTRFELESLLDLSRHGPAIDTDKYPDTKRECYWTSTPCAWSDSGVWVVLFGCGSVYGRLRPYDLACVRAVRSGEYHGDGANAWVEKSTGEKA